MDIGFERNCTAKPTIFNRCRAFTALRRRGENSDAKDAERGSGCSGRQGWVASRTPCGRGIARYKLYRSMREYDARLDYRHLRNNPSGKVEMFSRVAIRWARLRH